MKQLSQSVDRFISLVFPLGEEHLNRPWAWQAYTSEGVRFACFRVFEILRDLEMDLERERQQLGQPLTTAQQILARHHIAYGELQLTLRAVDGADADRPPAAEQWSVRRTLAHITAAEVSFLAVVLHALQQFRRSPDWQPQPPGDEDWDRIIELDEQSYRRRMADDIDGLRQTLAHYHQRTLDELSDIDVGELVLPSHFWEGYTLPLRFRLLRFESHMRQHTIQIEKTIEQLGIAHTEAHRLTRMIAQAHAAAEGQLIAHPQLGRGNLQTASDAIDQIADEVAPIVQQ